MPLRIEAVAKTDSTNLRLHFAKGHIIFNWEASPGQMACYEPVYGHPFHREGTGADSRRQMGEDNVVDPGGQHGGPG